MSRVELPVSQMRVRRRRRRTLVALSGVFLVIVFCAGIVAISRASFLRIEKIIISGTETLAPDILKQEVEAELEGFYFWLFPKSNIFFYPQDDLAQLLIQSSAIIKSATVEAQDFHTIEVHVVERSPKALWCEGVCYLMDEDGVVYERAPTFSSPAYTVYRGEAKKLAETETARQYLSTEAFREVSALVDALSQTQAPEYIGNVSVDEYHDVRAEFDGGPTILFVLGDDGGDVYERFTLAMQSEPFTEHSFKDFSYLDLRFGDKLYYKLKGQ